MKSVKSIGSLGHGDIIRHNLAQPSVMGHIQPNPAWQYSGLEHQNLSVAITPRGYSNYPTGAQSMYSVGISHEQRMGLS